MEHNRAYVVCWHYDSRVTDINDFTNDAPGADDDASGVAVSMELARVIATHESAATLIFAAVAGEEQGQFSSAFMAAQLKKDSGPTMQMSKACSITILLEAPQLMMGPSSSSISV
jgi:Zn-dependent M28 family amino/carboxypeptidase